MSTRRAIGAALAGLLLIAVVLALHAAIQRQLKGAAREAQATPTVVPTGAPSTATPAGTPTPVPTQSPTPEPTPSQPTNTPAPTVPAAPTATPLPAPPPTPVGPIVTDTKLGVGVYSSTMDMNTLRLLRPAMLLIQDPDPRTAQNYRVNFPKALIVGRHYMADGDPLLANCANGAEDHHAKGVALADYIAHTAVPLKGIVDAWVSDNEQASGRGAAQLTCHALFQSGFIEELQGKYGIAAVAGNDAPGAIEPADYPKYFAKPISEATYFGVHAYSKPGTRTLQNGDDSKFYALRYRLIHDALAQAGVPLPKGGFLLTETGLYEGWRGLVPDSKMAEDFIWLDKQTEQDPYVKGQFVFGLGTQERFRPFEIMGTRLIELLGAFNAQHPGKA